METEIKQSSHYKKYSAFYAFLLLLLVSFFPFWAGTHRSLLNDDTYITLTYAKNIALGNGFVYNHPPSTLGTTTPLLALSVGATGRLFPGIDIVDIAVYFTVCCWVGIIWVIFLFRKILSLKPWHAAIIGMIIIFSGWTHYLGMEAYLFAFLLVLASALFTARYYAAAGVALGLLFLTRGEGVLLLLLILFCLFMSECFLKKRYTFGACKPLVMTGVGFALPVIAWSIYAWCTFGRVLSSTLSAKMTHMSTGHFKFFWYTLTNKWLLAWGHEFSLAGFSLHYLWWFLVLLGLVVSIRKRWRRGLFFAWIFLYVFGYSLLRVPAYDWYQLPILFVLQIYAAFGLIACMEHVFHYGMPGRIAGIAFSVFVLFLFGNATIHRSMPIHRQDKLLAYIEVGRWLRTHTDPGDSVAYIEVGYLGYYSDNRIIDLAGLVTPDIIPHINENGFAWGFFHYKPDYYLCFLFFNSLLGAINGSDALKKQYHDVARIPVGQVAGYDVIVYKRNEGKAHCAEY